MPRTKFTKNRALSCRRTNTATVLLTQTAVVRVSLLTLFVDYSGKIRLATITDTYLIFPIVATVLQVNRNKIILQRH